MTYRFILCKKLLILHISEGIVGKVGLLKEGNPFYATNYYRCAQKPKLRFPSAAIKLFQESPSAIIS